MAKRKMLTIREWADKIGVTRQQAHKYLADGRVPGATQVEVEGQPRPVWRIPATAGKPDARSPGRKPIEP